MVMDNELEEQLSRLYRVFSAQKEAKVQAKLTAILNKYGLVTASALPCCQEAARTGEHPHRHDAAPVATSPKPRTTRKPQ